MRLGSLLGLLAVQLLATQKKSLRKRLLATGCALYLMLMAAVAALGGAGLFIFSLYRGLVSDTGASVAAAVSGGVALFLAFLLLLGAYRVIKR